MKAGKLPHLSPCTNLAYPSNLAHLSDDRIEDPEFLKAAKSSIGCLVRSFDWNRARNRTVMESIENALAILECECDYED